MELHHQTSGIVKLMPLFLDDSLDERTHRLIGREKVIGRLAGQMTSVIYALLKKDQELLSHLAPGAKPPQPALYDPTLHRQHRMGRHQSSRSGGKSRQELQLPAN